MRPGLALAVVAMLVLSGCSVSVEFGATTPMRTVDAHSVTVTNVIDGDTMEVLFPDGDVETVRLLGVDTPETHAESTPGEFEGIPDTDSGRAWLEEWGHRATTFADARLDGAEVRIQGDPMADRRGGYGRLLVYLYHNGTLFNRELLERGYARLYDSSFTKRDTFASIEADAQASDRGLWAYGSDTGRLEVSVRVTPPSPSHAARAQPSLGL